jgi:16S rRNA (cytosine1402-N4)-methyltransferase
LNEPAHKSVLLEEAVQALRLRRDGAYVDCTYGRGGHSSAILARLGERGWLLAFDRDPEAIDAARARFAGDARFEAVHEPFSRLSAEVGQRGRAGAIDGVLFDLGVSSPQLDAGGRGFSFLRDGELDMRFDPRSGQSAADWLNGAPEAEIADVLKRLGEERYARRIAGAIVRARHESPIRRTAELRDLIARSVPTREREKDPATRSFLAIRMHVNSELEELERALPQAVAVLRPGGRLAVISFHSLEDRLVKRFMRREASGDDLPPDFPIRHADLHPVLRIVGRAQRPADAEIARNPRARSAVLRVAEKVAA